MNKFILFFLLFPCVCMSQVATIKLLNGTYINNAPSGESWVDYQVTGFSLQEASDTLIIDDSNQDKISYYGNWRLSSDRVFVPELGNCHCSWSQSPSDSLVFKFTNTRRFEWYGEIMEHHGIVDLYWQDQFIMTIDTYSPANISLYRHWFIDDLDTDKVYKFKLVATGNKNIESRGYNIVNHGFMLINVEQAQDTIPPDVPIPVEVVDTIFIHDTVYVIKKDTIYLQPKIFIKADSLIFELN